MRDLDKISPGERRSSGSEDSHVWLSLRGALAHFLKKAKVYTWHWLSGGATHRETYLPPPYSRASRRLRHRHTPHRSRSDIARCPARHLGHRPATLSRIFTILQDNSRYNAQLQQTIYVYHFRIHLLYSVRVVYPESPPACRCTNTLSYLCSVERSS